MNALLDTHTVLFLATAPSRLGSSARALIESADAVLFTSIASLWELAIKTRLGKLSLPVPLGRFWQETCERGHLRVMNISEGAILRTMELDLTHRDPFDRLLAAQALESGLAFVSSDEAVDGWGVERVW